MAGVNYGAYHLADNPNIYSPARSNNFEFIVQGLDENLLRAGTSVQDQDSIIKNAQKIIRFSVDKTRVPHFAQETITIKRGNSTVKFAGAVSFDEGSLTVNDYIGADAKSVLMAWQNLSYDVVHDTINSNAAAYKKECMLVEYTPDYKLIRKWKMYGCWVSKIDEGEFDMNNADKRTITATIQYDKAVPDYD